MDHGRNPDTKKEVWQIVVDYIETRRDVELETVDRLRLRREFDDWFEQIYFDGFEMQSPIAIFKVISSFANSFKIDDRKEEEKMVELLLDDARDIIRSRERTGQKEVRIEHTEILSHLRRFLNAIEISVREYIELRRILFTELDYIRNTYSRDKKVDIITNELGDLVEEVRQSEEDELYVSKEATISYIKDSSLIHENLGRDLSSLRSIIKEEMRTFRREAHQKIETNVEEILESEGGDLNITQEEIASFIKQGTFQAMGDPTEWEENPEYRKKFKRFINRRQREEKRNQRKMLRGVLEVMTLSAALSLLLDFLINELGIEIALLNSILTPVVSTLTNPGVLVGIGGILVTLALHFWEPFVSEAMLEETEKELSERIQEQNEILSQIQNEL